MPQPRIPRPRSPRRILQALWMPPQEHELRAWSLPKRDQALVHDEVNCSVSSGAPCDPMPAPVIDGAAVGGNCNLWCVPGTHASSDVKAGRGHIQRRGIVSLGEVAADVATATSQPQSTSRGSDAGSDGDIFESTRLGMALEQLMSERAEKDAAFGSARGASSSRPDTARSENIKALRSMSMHSTAFLEEGTVVDENYPPVACRDINGIARNCYSVGSIDSFTESEVEIKPLASSAYHRPSSLRPREDQVIPRKGAELVVVHKLHPSTESPRVSIMTARSDHESARKSTCSRHRDTSADDVFTNLLGVHSRRRTMLGGGDGPLIRPPRAVALSEDVPMLRRATAVGSKEIPNAWKAFNTKGQSQAASAHRRSASAISQADIQAVLRKMPLLRLGPMPDD